MFVYVKKLGNFILNFLFALHFVFFHFSMLNYIFSLVHFSFLDKTYGKETLGPSSSSTSSEGSVSSVSSIGQLSVEEFNSDPRRKNLPEENSSIPTVVANSVPSPHSVPAINSVNTLLPGSSTSQQSSASSLGSIFRETRGHLSSFFDSVSQVRYLLLL